MVCPAVLPLMRLDCGDAYRCGGVSTLAIAFGKVSG